MHFFQKITAPEVQKYISENLNSDLTKLLLKKSPFPEVSMQEIAQQIKGKQIAAKKFPFLLKENIVFPPHLNLEQASSESTAKEKAENLYGGTFLDLTCGFGIDAYFLSQNFSEVTLLEQNKDLLEIVQHNWKTLGREANFINENLEHFLEINEKQFDLIYLDPARRDKDHRKKFLLSDLSPNILEIQDKLLSISKKTMIKLSPLIDLKYLQTAVKSINEIEIIAVKNEVKEIVLHLIPNTENKLKITTKNLSTDEPNFSFSPEEESAVTPEFSDILEYLYIPNNAVLKSGAFNLISKKTMIKLSPLIDLKYLQSAVKSIDEIEIIAVKNEVKEIVLHLIPNTENKPKITTKNLSTDEPNFSFSPEEESAVTPEFSDILEYLYIPNNAVLKSGAFNLISKKFRLKKLHPNTHLYTSDKAVDFCGRVFKAKEISAKEIKKGDMFNIISKNHPLSPEQIKTKYKLKNGGEHYLVFTQSKKGKVILQTL